MAARLVVPAILALALVKGLLLIGLVPPFQSPDEYGHYDYALFLSKVDASAFLKGPEARPIRLSFTRYVTEELHVVADATGVRPHLDDATIVRSRPSFREASALAAEASVRDSPAALAQATDLHTTYNYPPLYYGSLGAVLRLLQAAGFDPVSKYYSARLFSLFLFLLTLAAAARLLGEMRLPPLAAHATLLALGLHPQLSLQSVSVQPDGLTLLLVTLTLWLLLRILVRPSERLAAGLGVALGLLLLTKLHVVPPLWLGAMGTLAVARNSRAVPGRRSVNAALVTTVAMCAVGGWWYLRSWLLYENWLGLVAWQAAPGASASFTANLTDWLGGALGQTFRSYWGEWGWQDYGLPAWTLPVLAGASVAPGLLLALRLWASLDRWQWSGLLSRTRRSPRRLWLLAITLVLATFGLEMLAIAGMMGRIHNQGRQWLPFAVPQMLYFCASVAMLTGTGLRWLARFAASRRGWFAGTALVLAVPAAVAVAVQLARVPVDAFVEVQMQVSVDSHAELFYDPGGGFNPDDASRQAVRTRDRVATRRFPVQAAAIRALRLDPFVGEGTARIRRVEILDPGGRKLADLSPAAAVALKDVARLEPDGQSLLLRSTSGSIDPSIVWTLPAPMAFERGPTRRLADTTRRIWRGVSRRVPFAAALPDAWAALLLVTSGLWWLARLPDPATAGDRLGRLARRARTSLAVVLATGFLLMNAYLIAATLRFYG